MVDSYGEADLKVVAERPVTQHLEEGVVVRVLADIVEVCALVSAFARWSDRLTVVLAAGTNALLRVHRADELAQVGSRVGGTKEQGFVLVHTLSISARFWRARQIVVSGSPSSPCEVHGAQAYGETERGLTALANSRVSSSNGMTPLEGQKVCSNPSVSLK